MTPARFQFVLRHELWMRKMTQRELAKRVGQTPRVVNSWVRGHVKPPLVTMVGVLVLLRGEWDYEEPAA